MADEETPDIDWKGRDVVDPDGQKVGSIEEVYVDGETGRPKWLLVKRGLLALGTTFVPFEGAEETGDGDVRIPHAKDHVGEAPAYQPGPEGDQDHEAAIHRHYDLAPPEGAEEDDEDDDESPQAGQEGAEREQHEEREAAEEDSVEEEHRETAEREADERKAAADSEGG